MKLPKEGTRVRAVFHYLFDTRRMDDKPARWCDLRDAYGDGIGSLPPLRTRSRQYIGMSMAPILKKYANRVARGQYVMKDIWYDLAKYPLKAVPLPPEKVPNPFAHCAVVIVPGAPFQAGDQVICTEPGTSGNHLEEGRGYTIKKVYKETYCDCGWMVLVNTPEHGDVAVYSSRFKLVPKPKPAIVGTHIGREPKMADICGTCGEQYGNHFGDKWPGLTDCPVMGEYGPKRSEPDQKMRFWTTKVVVQGSPEIEDMAWHQKFNEAYDAKVERETEVAMLEAAIDQMEIADVRAHKKIEDLEKQIKTLNEDKTQITKVVDNKNVYIGQIERKLTEVAERSHNRQKLIDETKDENLLLQSRLENGKTAVDTAREMLGAMNHTQLESVIEALDALDAQLSGTYGVLDGTMDE